MTHTPHTPAPWLIGEDQCVDECWSVVTTSGGAIIANVNDKAARQANARLIAAAPDMLAALDRLETLVRVLPPDMDEPDSALAQAHRAIAKARGVQS